MSIVPLIYNIRLKIWRLQREYVSQLTSSFTKPFTIHRANIDYNFTLQYEYKL
jgi:hypothetical protein